LRSASSLIGGARKASHGPDVRRGQGENSFSARLHVPSKIWTPSFILKSIDVSPVIRLSFPL
jgi:hypothetical protein